jgi:hypothetical protein
LQLLFAITFFVNHRASGVADFPSPDDPMLTLFFVIKADDTIEVHPVKNGDDKTAFELVK